MAKPFVRVAQVQQTQPLVDKEGRPVAWFVRLLNDNISNLAEAVNTLAQIPEIQAALQGLDEATQAAQLAADNAQAAADNAAMAGGQTASATALANSYPTGVVIDASTTGLISEITISDHDRVYATNPTTTVPVTGGTIPNLDSSTRYFIYYDQPSRAGGTVAYVATEDQTVVAQINDRHSVGYVDTPPAGQPNKFGYSVVPPGANYEVLQ